MASSARTYLYQQLGHRLRHDACAYYYWRPLDNMMKPSPLHDFRFISLWRGHAHQRSKAKHLRLDSNTTLVFLLAFLPAAYICAKFAMRKEHDTLRTAMAKRSSGTEPP